MALECVQEQRIAGSANAAGDELTLPLIADETGTWSIHYNDDTSETFPVTNGENIVIPADYLTQNEDNTIQIRRSDGYIFGNTCYIINVGIESVTLNESANRIQGKVTLTLDSETASGDTVLDTIGANFVDVYRNGSLQSSGYTWDETTGEFVWSYEDGDVVVIKYYKS